MTALHGGKRAGSGRKKIFKEQKTTVACPKSFAPQVRSIIANMMSFDTLYNHQHYVGEPALSPTRLYRPVSLTKVPAGFPSPADDYIESQLDLNEFFVTHPSASFYWKVSGDSMNLAGILDGAILLIDRSLTVKSNDIVLATIHGDITVKRFVHVGSSYELRPDSSFNRYKTLQFGSTEDISIWGVVSAVFNKLR